MDDRSQRARLEIGLSELRRKGKRGWLEADNRPSLNRKSQPILSTAPQEEREIAVSAGCPIRSTLIQGLLGGWQHWSRKHCSSAGGGGSQVTTQRARPCERPHYRCVCGPASLSRQHRAGVHCVLLSRSISGLVNRGALRPAVMQMSASMQHSDLTNRARPLSRSCDRGHQGDPPVLGGQFRLNVAFAPRPASTGPKRRRVRRATCWPASSQRRWFGASFGGLGMQSASRC